MRQIFNKTGKAKEGKKQSIQVKLIVVFLLTSFVLLVVNLVLYQSMNRIIHRLDNVYATNVSLNELQDILDHTHFSLTEYLNTKSTDAMQDYFLYEDEYLDMIKKLNKEAVNNELLIMEKNIRGISEEYLNVTDKAIDAKRGRNVDKYKV